MNKSLDVFRTAWAREGRRVQNRGFTLSYSNKKETILLTIDPHYGNIKT